MKKTIHVKNDELLKTIYKIIYDKQKFVTEKGFIDGKAGIALFFYQYANQTNDRDLSDLAHFIVNEIWDRSLLTGTSSNFINGKTGFSWFFQEIIDMGIIQPNPQLDDVLKNFDRSIIQQRLQNPIPLDTKSDFFSSGLVLIKRYKEYDKYDDEDNDQDKILYKYLLREQLIYLIGECERMLYDQTAFNDILKPNWTLRLFGSMFFFLTKCAKYGIFPYKTEKLLQYIVKLSEKLLPFTDILNLPERVSFKDLLSSQRSFIQPESYGNIENESISGIDTGTAECEVLLDILSRAGLYSLLYENNVIFSQVYNHVINQHPSLHDKLTKHLKKQKDKDINLSLNGLSAIGYGLLSLLN